MAQLKRKPNWFDLLVVVILLGILAAAGYKYMQPPVAVEEVPIAVTILVEGVREMTINNVKEGDPVREDLTGMGIGRIAKVNFSTFMKEVDTQDGRVILTPVAHRYTMEITIHTTGMMDARGAVFARNDWQIGKRLGIKTDKIRTEGFIVAMKKGWD